MEIHDEVHQFILDNFMYTDDAAALADDMSLIDTGVVDSTGVLELVGHIEETFGIQVDDADLVPDNFDSVSRIVRYVKSKVG